MTDHANSKGRDPKRPHLIDAEDCTWCDRRGVRVAVFDEGGWDATNTYLCADCIQLGLDTIQETP